MNALRTELSEIAHAHDVAGFGVCAADPFDEARVALERSVEDGMNGGLRFTFHDPDTSTDPQASFPWAERLVVVSRAYLPQAGSPVPTPGEGIVARFAVEDPYEPLEVALAEIASRLMEAGYQAEVLVDDNRLVDRAAARRAGIAWQGKSTMMLDPKHGPWIVLGSVITDALLPVDEPMVRGCGTCDACIPACPTGAIVEPGVLDARLCLAAWAQTAGMIPHEYREAMGSRLYGCDDCLDACPPGLQLLGSATKSRGGVDLVELLGTADHDLRARFVHFYLPKHDPDVLRRNALVVLGNRGDSASVGVISGYLGYPNSVLRAHAAWALGRMDSDLAAPALSMAKEGETDATVLEEIEMALGG